MLIETAAPRHESLISWSASPTGALRPASVVELLAQGQPLVTFPWGRHDAFGTAAYWVAQVGECPYGSLISAGGELIEDLVFCLLGGYGITAAMNDAAFRCLVHAGLVTTDPVPESEEIEAVLRVPLNLRAHREPVRYRFPRQRAVRLNAALAKLREGSLPSSPLELRDALLDFHGIGPKTASWIVRNQTGSDEVAIIDVHLRRAGLAAGFFRAEWRLPEDYHLFEWAFLAYAGAGGVAAAGLDVCIWDQVRRLGRARARFLPSPSRMS